MSRFRIWRWWDDFWKTFFEGSPLLLGKRHENFANLCVLSSNFVHFQRLRVTRENKRSNSGTKGWHRFLFVATLDGRWVCMWVRQVASKICVSEVCVGVDTTMDACVCEVHSPNLYCLPHIHTHPHRPTSPSLPLHRRILHYRDFGYRLLIKSNLNSREHCPRFKLKKKILLSGKSLSNNSAK